MIIFNRHHVHVAATSLANNGSVRIRTRRQMDIANVYRQLSSINDRVEIEHYSRNHMDLSSMESINSDDGQIASEIKRKYHRRISKDIHLDLILLRSGHFFTSRPHFDWQLLSLWKVTHYISYLTLDIVHLFRPRKHGQK